MKNSRSNSHKIIHLDEVWKTRGKGDNLLAVLRDSRRVAQAIKQRTCILCQKMKMCVNKTGLCVACYLNLTPQQKKVADEEASHKQIVLKVTDNRWERT